MNVKSKVVSKTNFVMRTAMYDMRREELELEVLEEEEEANHRGKASTSTGIEG